MPERIIRRINRLDASDRMYIGRFAIFIDADTWETFHLTGKDEEFVKCQFVQLLDEEGATIITGNEEHLYKTFLMDTLLVKYRRLILPDEFTQLYGVKRNQFIDLLLLEVIQEKGTPIPIYSKRLAFGILDIIPKDGKTKVPIPLELLIDIDSQQQYYSDLIIEINKAYSYGLYTATLVLIRKLFENLIIELLRARYGMANVQLFYNTDKGRFHNFSTLITNLQNKLDDFKPFTSSFGQDLIKFLSDLKEKGNASAHSLEIICDNKILQNWKSDINKYYKLVVFVIEKCSVGGH